jgi:hypothetical protein
MALTRILVNANYARHAGSELVETQEAGIATLAGLGVRVLTARGDDLTDSDDEMRVAMRQTARLANARRSLSWRSHDWSSVETRQ